MLPLSATLPDLKSDTTSYIHLQNLYKAQAQAEKAQFVQILEDVRIKAGVSQPIPTVLVDEFVKNCHQLKILKGKQFGNEVDAALGDIPPRICSPCPNHSADCVICTCALVEAIATNPSQVATHLALSALFRFEALHKRWPTPGSNKDLKVLEELVGARLKAAGYVGENAQDVGLQVDEAATGTANLTFKQHLVNSLGEMCVSYVRVSLACGRLIILVSIEFDLLRQNYQPLLH